MTRLTSQLPGGGSGASPSTLSDLAVMAFGVHVKTDVFSISDCEYLSISLLK